MKRSWPHLLVGLLLSLLVLSGVQPWLRETLLDVRTGLLMRQDTAAISLPIVREPGDDGITSDESGVQEPALHASRPASARDEPAGASHALSLIALAALMLAMAGLWHRTRPGVRLLGLAFLVLGAEAAAIALQAGGIILLDTSLIVLAALGYGLAAVIGAIDLRRMLGLADQRQFERIAMSLSDGLVCVDAKGKITLWNPGASAIFGHPEQAAIGQPFEFLLAPQDEGGRPFVLTSLPLASLQQRGGAVIELVGARRSGEVFDLELSLSCWQTAAGVHYGVILRDISPRKRQQEHIRYLAECDPVTGLANCNSLMAHLGDAILPERHGTATLLLVGVKRLQQVNNLYGHSFGDALMAEIGARLRTIAAPAALIARLDSDEFAILLTGDGGSDAAALGEAIISNFENRSVIVGERRRRISVAVGLASARDAGHAETWVGNAHFALVAAKARRHSAPVAFDPRMRRGIEEREALEIELRAALANNQFELFYQPQIDMRTGTVVGAEALIRWRHRERGYVSPAAFMPVVNTSALSEDVAAWVLETACRRAADWQRRGHAMRIAVNLSQSQFTTGDLAADVERLLARNGLRPELLELELTEDIILDDGDATLRVLAALRALGVKIAFDDFGTGYGSLTYLKTFPLDKIKIDQSFVRALEPGTQGAAIVAATISLGQALGLSVIAEGIETEAVAALLREMGCDEGQGYLIGKPIPAREFERTFLTKETVSAKETVLAKNLPPAKPARLVA